MPRLEELLWGPVRLQAVPPPPRVAESTAAGKQPVDIHRFIATPCQPEVEAQKFAAAPLLQLQVLATPVVEAREEGVQRGKIISVKMKCLCALVLFLFLSLSCFSLPSFPSGPGLSEVVFSVRLLMFAVFLPPPQRVAGSFLVLNQIVDLASPQPIRT